MGGSRTENAMRELTLIAFSDHNVHARQPTDVNPTAPALRANAPMRQVHSCREMAPTLASRRGPGYESRSFVHRRLGLSAAWSLSQIERSRRWAQIQLCEEDAVSDRPPLVTGYDTKSPTQTRDRVQRKTTTGYAVDLFRVPSPREPLELSPTQRPMG